MKLCCIYSNTVANNGAGANVETSTPGVADDAYRQTTAHKPFPNLLTLRKPDLFLTPLPRHSKEVLPCRPHRQRKVAKPVQISAHATQSRRNGLHVLLTFNHVAIKLAPFVLHASLKNTRVSKEALQTKTFRGRINEASMYVAALHMAN